MALDDKRDIATCGGCGRAVNVVTDEFCSYCGFPNGDEMLRRGHLVALSDEDLALIIDALDSHVYWQLSEVAYRSSGNVLPPGSDDPEVAEEIAQAERLGDRLRR